MNNKHIIDAFNIWEYERVIVLITRLLHLGYKDQELYYMLSFSLFQRWKFSESLSILEQGLSLYPNDFRLEELNLLIDFSLGNTQEILQKISYLHETKSYQSEYLCNLECQVYVDVHGNYTRAIQLYTEYLKVYPESGILKYYFWLLQLKRGELQIAMWLFQESLDRNFLYAYYGIVKCLKQNPWLCVSTSYFIHYFLDRDELKNDFTCLWNIFYELWEYKIALSFYSKSLKNIPTDYCTYNGIWNVLYKTWKYEESSIYYLKALKMRKEDVYAYNGLWNIFFSKKNYAKALSFYLKWYKEWTENAYHLYKVGMCYYFLSDFTLSLEFLEKSLTYNSKNSMAMRYVKKTLKKLER